MFKRKKKQRYIMEIRNARTLKLIDSEVIKGRRKYEKMCDRLSKLVNRHINNSLDDELLIRVKINSYLVRNGKNYGYVVGLIPIKH